MEHLLQKPALYQNPAPYTDLVHSAVKANKPWFMFGDLQPKLVQSALAMVGIQSALLIGNHSNQGYFDIFQLLMSHFCSLFSINILVLQNT